jgi:hypothetical protein
MSTGAQDADGLIQGAVQIGNVDEAEIGHHEVETVGIEGQVFGRGKVVVAVRVKVSGDR